VIAALRWLAVAALVATVGCADDSTDLDEQSQTQLPTGGKFDTPTDSAEENCMRRRADALQSNKSMFTPTALRWPVADVEGVNTNNHDNRGQEYTEYFAIAHLPPAREGEERPAPVKVGAIVKTPETLADDFNIETTPLALDLTDDQIIALETNPDEVYATCVFTSWHTDIHVPVTNCWDPDERCDEIMGFPMTAEHFRMKLNVNSNDAAQGLVETCNEKDITGGDPAKSDDPRHDPFIRGCMLTHDYNKTSWKASDTTVCIAVMRLRECGCKLDQNYDTLGSILPPVPEEDADYEDEDFFLELRGFPLGSWEASYRLPAGCRYAELGDFSNTVVLCDLNGIEVLNHAGGLKRRCAEKWADELVVHVPLPTHVPMVCEPPADGQYSSQCRDNMPWVLQP